MSKKLKRTFTGVTFAATSIIPFGQAVAENGPNLSLEDVRKAIHNYQPISLMQYKELSDRDKKSK